MIVKSRICKSRKNAVIIGENAVLCSGKFLFDFHRNFLYNLSRQKVSQNGVLIGSLNLPVVFGAALTIGIGTALTIGEDHWKKAWIGYKKEDYILFHIIKSMDMPTYVGLMLTLIVIGIYYIIKYRRVKVPWIILVYFMVVNSIVLIINRIIEEYQSNTHLEKISSNVALISSGIFIASIFVVGIITKIKEKR